VTNLPEKTVVLLMNANSVLKCDRLALVVGELARHVVDGAEAVT
jgi:hypothetical protein